LIQLVSWSKKYFGYFIIKKENWRQVYIMRNLLVVVDMQNDFIDGSLGTKEAVAIVDNVIAEKEDITVTLVGLCTDICVVSNAILIKAYLSEIPVKVIASCCAGVTPESHEAALTTMRMCQVQVE